MANPSEHPHLSGPDEDPECYACGATIGGTPWTVAAGTLAAKIVRVPDDELVEVCDDCMSSTTDEVREEIRQIVGPLDDTPESDRG